MRNKESNICLKVFTVPQCILTCRLHIKLTIPYFHIFIPLWKILRYFQNCKSKYKNSFQNNSDSIVNKATSRLRVYLPQ